MTHVSQVRLESSASSEGDGLKKALVVRGKGMYSKQVKPGYRIKAKLESDNTSNVKKEREDKKP
jgi:hypothetical protein